MNCREAQALITEYVNGQLDLKQLEEFILHIEHCGDCKEELEVYYIVFTGIKRMDLDDNIAINYHDAFLNTIERNKNIVKRAKIHHIARRIVFSFLLVITVIVSSISINSHGVDIESIYLEEGNSEYNLKFYFYSNKHTQLEEYILTNFPEYREIRKLETLKNIEE